MSHCKRRENHRIYRTRIYRIIGYIEQSASPQASTIVVYIECLLAVAAFSALTLLVGRQQGHPACKKLSGGVLEGTVRHCQSKEASILWSHHEESTELPGERDNERNNARYMQARKTMHCLDRQHKDVDRTPRGRVNQNDRGQG